ncbi:MAG TPA: PKD domain-containing protein, partial [Polyangiaceae bacterium]|nr:PKD domain-containing protein [Polyangiaceae bacterium]
GCSALDGKDKGKSDPSGTVQLEATIAPGINIDEVDYSIEVPGKDPIKGSLSVASDGVVSGAVESVPAADDVKITLTASGSDGTKCEGDGTVDVAAGKTTSVSIVLQCRLPDGTEVTTGNISVKASFNVCPQLLTATADASSSDGCIAVNATATDLDKDALTFSWSADAGSFDDAAAASATYSCAGAGTQTLTVTVTDSDGCSNSKEVTVTCPETAADAGAATDAGDEADAGAVVDAASPLDAGSVEEDAGSEVDSGSPADDVDSGSPADDVDSGSPADEDAASPADAGTTPPAPLCEGTAANACEDCACSSCTSQMDACKSATGTASEGPAAGQAKADLCAAVVRCGQDAGCRGSACYCGTADLVSCLTGSANGPCMPEIQAAAETSDVVTIQDRQTNTSYAVGLANAVSTCSENSCASACGTQTTAM